MARKRIRVALNYRDGVPQSVLREIAALRYLQILPTDNVVR